MCWLDFICRHSQEIKDISAAIQSLSVSVGVIIGGSWALWLFYKHRQKYPQANLSHNISHEFLSDDKVLLRISVAVQNVGNVIISLNRCDIRVQQIIPVGDKINELLENHYEMNDINEKSEFLDYEIQWPLLKHVELECKDGLCGIEPNEIEQFCYDFIIDSNVKTISFYSHFINQTIKGKKELGWHLTTIYNLK